jgi:hypothetical protein
MLLIAGGLIVIGAIIYFIIIPVFKTNAPAANVNVNNNLNSSLPVTNNSKPVTNIPPPPAEVAPEAQAASAARTVALTFAERFATYTNQNGLINLNDLEAISTPAVWSFIKGSYKSDLLKTLPDPKDYYAMTSTALNAKIAPLSDTEMSATVPMQRVESGTVSKTTYATLDLKLKKINDVWLVSWEEWEK